MSPDYNNLMEAATALAELRKTHLEALSAASSASTNPITTAAQPPTVLPTKGKFPARMHTLLSDPSVSDAITWLPNGRSFVVLRPDILSTQVLPRYFSSERCVRYTSFTRKLNRWGFRQISQGSECGAFFHELFLREDPDACLDMVCAKSRKSKDAKSVSSAATMSRTDTKPVVSAAVTVSTNGVSLSLRSLPIKKRRGIGNNAVGIPSNVETKPNNTCLLAKRMSITSFDSGLSDDDKVSTVSKDSAPVDKSNAVFAIQQEQVKKTAKETLAYYFQQAKDANNLNKSCPSLTDQQEAIESAKKALAHNFHEQYRAFALASLMKNSQLAKSAIGMDADSSTSAHARLTPALKPQDSTSTYYVPRAATAETITYQAQQSEAAAAAKRALYEAYKKAINPSTI
jgi:hypothetical protein